jgi:hypothetical protein
MDPKGLPVFSGLDKSPIGLTYGRLFGQPHISIRSSFEKKTSIKRDLALSSKIIKTVWSNASLGHSLTKRGKYDRCV